MPIDAKNKQKILYINFKNETEFYIFVVLLLLTIIFSHTRVCGGEVNLSSVQRNDTEWDIWRGAHKWNSLDSSSKFSPDLVQSIFCIMLI